MVRKRETEREREGERVKCLGWWVERERHRERVKGLRGDRERGRGGEMIGLWSPCRPSRPLRPPVHTADEGPFRMS